MTPPDADLDVPLRLGTALLLGSAIGIERQFQQKMAGLRTNALVALGAGGFVVFSCLVSGNADPTRIAAQIVSGIGFLGAGVILREGINVHGLNTAATLWCSALVGTFAGGGLFRAAAIAAALVVLTNLVLRPLVRAVNTQVLIAGRAETHYTLSFTCRGSDEASLRLLMLRELTAAGLGLKRLDSADVPETALVSITANAMSASRNDTALERIVGRVCLEPTVSQATWQVDRAIPE